MSLLGSYAASSARRAKAVAGAALLVLLAAASAPTGYAQTITVGSPQLVYTTAEMGGVAGIAGDQPLTTLKRDSSSLYFYRSRGVSGGVHVRSYGSLGDPFQVQDWRKSDTQLWNYNGYPTSAAFWLMNIYKHSDGTLIGMVHIENPATSSDRKFHIGVGVSVDGGDTWKFCGEILFTQRDMQGGPDGGDNINGSPLLRVGSYLYTYFSEVTNAGDKYYGVARAPIADVVAAAKNGTVTSWKKYRKGAWNEDGLTGVASRLNISVLPGAASGSVDAAYSSTLGKYMMAVRTSDAQGRKLWIVTSSDGLNWGDEVLVTTLDSPYFPAYPAFAGISGASDDGLSMGANFTIYWFRHTFTLENSEFDLYRASITTTSSFPSQTVFYGLRNLGIFAYMDVDSGVAEVKKKGSAGALGDDKQWRFAQQEPGWYRISNKIDGRFLDVDTGNSNLLAKATTAPVGDDKLWSVTAQGGGYVIRNKQTGQYIDLDDADPNVKVKATTAPVGDDKVWVFEPQ